VTGDAILDLLHNNNNINNNNSSSNMTTTNEKDQDQTNMISEWESAAPPESMNGNNANANGNNANLLSLNLKEMNSFDSKYGYGNGNGTSAQQQQQQQHYSHQHPTFKTDTNHFQLSPKLKMNPRDAASPRRSRIVTKRKEYDTGAAASPPAPAPASSSSHTMMNTNNDNGNSGNNGNSNPNSNSNQQHKSSMSPYPQSYSQMDAGSVSLSQQSYKTESESTMHSASVGGLQYIESMSMSISSTASSSRRQGNAHVNANVKVNANANANAAGTGGGRLRTADPFPNPNWSQAHPQSSTASRSSHAQSQSQSQSASVSASVSSKLSKRSISNNNRHVKKRSLQLGEEQILFEQRLCDHNYGVAVRKIHSNGKSQLRYVKCIPFANANANASIGMGAGSRAGKKQNSAHHNMSLSVPDAHTRKNYSSSKSVTSLMGRISLGSKRSKSRASASASGSVSGALNGHGHGHGHGQLQKQSMALTWGNKRKVIIPLCHFVAVKKGKTTGRTRRNPCDASCLLSLVTIDDKKHGHGSLDIEAPTKLDRDKFAKAFSVFLDIPLEDDFVGEDVNVNFAKEGDDGYMRDRDQIPDDLSSLPSTSTSTASSVMTPYGLVEYQIGGSLLPTLASSPASPVSRDSSSKLIMEKEDISTTELSVGHLSRDSKMSADSLVDLLPPSVKREQGLVTEMENADADANANENENENADADVIKPIPDAKKERKRNDDDNDALSAVSSLTQGFDQEIVEELHQALNELKAELDASRAEAARAVKVAEQAIQSAESCSSKDWNSTVTHKAAEAAAQAQKRSAEAIAKQRLAEEKLAAERKSAAFWRKQAQNVEDEASALQTRLAVAQVQRAAVTDDLDREKHRAASYIHTLKRDYSMQESIQRESLASAAEQNRLLEIELDGTRRDLTAKSEEAKTLFDSVADLKSDMVMTGKNGKGMKFFGKGKKLKGPLLLDSQMNSTADDNDLPRTAPFETIHTEELLKIQAEASAMKKQFQILRRTTADELNQLPQHAKEWATQSSKAVNTSQSEVKLLKSQLALEISSRRKLLHEVQDLRGTVRVYCRPRPPTKKTGAGGIISAPSHELGLLHREEMKDSKGSEAVPMCFEFDRMFPTNASQSEIYAEMEELVLGSLEGFNACLMAYGQADSGKTYSMLGNIEISEGDGFGDDAMPIVNVVNHGIHLLAARQLFQVSSDRKDRFEDSFPLSVLEIHD